MYKKTVKDFYINNKGTKRLTLPKKWGVTKKENGKHIDKAFIAQLYGFKKYSVETKAYIFLEIARELIEETAKKVRKNPYITDELGVSKEIIKAKQKIGESQRKLDNHFNILNEVDNILYKK